MHNIKEERSSFIYSYLPIALSILLILSMYYDVLFKMAKDWWTDPNYSHGFLIPIISLYILWERRGLLKKIRPSASVLGLFVLLLGCSLFLFGRIGGELFSQRLSFLITIIGCIIFFGGKKLWQVVRFPIVYLIFMIPLPYLLYDTIAFPLKLFATKFSSFVLQTIGVSIYHEGNLIYLPNTTLEVVNACSGIRSLISIIAIAVIIALYTNTTTFKRMLIIALSIPVVLFSNMLRIIITGFLAQYYPNIATSFFHSFSGGIIFLIGVSLIFFIAFSIGSGRREAVHDRDGDDVDGMDMNEDVSNHFAFWSWSVPLILGVFLGLNLFATKVEATSILKSLSKFPNDIGGFHKVSDEAFDKSILDNLGVDSYLMRAYTGPGSYSLWLYIGYYEDQKEGAMIHSPKHCYPGGGWHPLSSKIVKINIPKLDKTISVNEYVLSKGGEKQLVYYWYQSRGRVIANEYKDRFYMIMDSLFRHRSDGALIRISGPAKDLEKARSIQVDFIKKIYPIISNYLPS